MRHTRSLSLFMLTACFFLASEAAAQTRRSAFDQVGQSYPSIFAVETQGALGFNGTTETDTVGMDTGFSVGAGVRLGFDPTEDSERWKFIPELQMQYNRFRYERTQQIDRWMGGEKFPISLSADQTYQFFGAQAGARVGAMIGGAKQAGLKHVALYAFGHGGYGFMHVGGEESEETAILHGFGFDVGGALNFGLTQTVALGVHAAHNRLLFEGRSVYWADAGLHVEFTF